jgi:alpha-glucosidase (family GH31 glycosyl hydrolase)
MAKTKNEGPALLAAGQPVVVSLVPASERTIRVTVSAPGAPGAPATPQVPGEPVLAPRAWPAPAATLRAAGESAAVGAFTAAVSCGAGGLAITLAHGGRPIQALAIDPAARGLAFDAGAGPLYGLGSGHPQQMDRKGSVYEPLNGQILCEQEQFGARVHVPLLLSTDGWALFVHLPFHATIDLRGERGRLTAAGLLLPLDLFLTVSPDPADLLAEHAALVGPTPLPPRWAMGYQQSHRTLEHAGGEQVLATARAFREKHLPCDALIYLGTGYCPVGWNKGHGSFEFHEVFGDAEATVAELHRMGFKVILHVLHHPSGLHGVAGEPVPAGDERHVAAYWRKHRFLLGPRFAVDGFWPDEGDDDDIPARLSRQRMYYEGPLSDRPGVRPFSFHRTGYPGMQRWGGNLWSGDTFSWWRTLASHLPIALNASLSATLYWQSDTGGFFPTRELTGELYARWFQLSAFSAYFRSHGRTWFTRRPWGWNTGDLGPDEAPTGYPGLPGIGNPDPAELHNEAVEPICRKYLELRYRLLPYIYSLAFEAWQRGLPLMRPLWLHFPDDPAAVRCADQYLFGPSLLVAPVVEKGAASRRVYLPRGLWYDYWTRETVEGGRTVERPVDLATMPIYVRAGAVLPLDPVREFVGQLVDGPTALEVWPGADGSFLLYDDDGISTDYLEGKGSRTALTWSDAGRTLALEAREGARPPAARRYAVRSALGGATREIVFDGARVTVTL